MGATMFAERSRLWGAALTVLLLAGCGAGGDDRVRVAAVRFIDVDPERHFDRSTIVSSEDVFDWTFRSPVDLEGWRTSLEPDEVSVSDAGLLLSPDGQYVEIGRRIDLDAASVDALELRVRGLRRHPVTMQWAGPGEEFSPERMITLDRGRGEDDFKLYRLVTAGHPGWRGTIRKVKFGLTLPKVRRVVVDRIRGIVESVPAERLAEAVDRPWKVELGQDVRSAMLAVPGEPIRRTVELPPGAELWLSYGVQPRVVGPVRFAVAALRADGRRQLLFDEVASAADQWHDATVDLGGLAGETVTLELSTSADGGFSPEIGFPVWANPEIVAAGERARPNVILVSIDTLRADRMSLYGHDRPTTPHIDVWARDHGVVFETAVAAAPWTLPSHVSMFTGLDAVRHGVNQNRPAAASLTLLAEVMRSAGYSTAAVTGGGFVHPQFGFAQGFDRYWSYGIRMGSEDEIEQEVDEACDVLERLADRPFFLFFHTYEVHNPFRPRQPYYAEYSGGAAEVTVDVTDLPESADDGYRTHRGLVVLRDGEPPQPLREDQIDLALDLYDAGIAYTDAMFARVLRRLEHLGLDDRTVVVLTSDHGEMFGEHGEFNHVSLYDENLLVPLVIVDPRRHHGQRISRQVRLIDLMPTVLELLDLEAPADLDGVSLVPLLDGGELPDGAGLAWSYAAASNNGVSLRRDDRLKYMVRIVPWPFLGPAERLFEVGGDGGERRIESPPGAVLDELRQVVVDGLQARMHGTRLRLVGGPGMQPLSGSLSAGRYLAQRVKTLGPGGVRLQFDPPRGMRFDIPAGEVVDLVLDDVGDQLTLRLDAPSPRGSAFEAVVDLNRLEGVLQVVPTPDGWRQQTAGEPAGQGVSLWWHDRALGRDNEVGEAVLDQLEALGYVH